MDGSGTGKRFVAVSGHVYRMLLVVYPKKFRREYGAQMEQVFRDQCRNELRRGRALGMLRLWVHAVLDLIRTAFAERWGSVSEEEIVGNYRLVGIGVALLRLLFISYRRHC